MVNYILDVKVQNSNKYFMFFKQNFFIMKFFIKPTSFSNPYAIWVIIHLPTSKDCPHFTNI